MFSIAQPTKKAPLIKVSSKLDLCLNVLIFLFIFIRVFGFWFVPNGVNQDEAMNAVDAFSLSRYGTDRFGTFLPAHLMGWEVGQQSSLMSYLEVPFIWLFGFNIFSIRLPMVIMGLLGCFCVYLLVKKLFNETYAKIALLLAISSPVLFKASRWSLDCNLLPHFFIIGFTLLVFGLEKKKYLYISMIFFAACMYSYGLAFYCVTIFLCIACIVLFINKNINIKDIILCLLIYLGLSWPIYLTMFVNFMGWDTISLPFVTIPLFPKSTRASDILFFSQDFLSDFILNLMFLIVILFFQNTTITLAGLISFPFMMMGLIYVFQQNKGKNIYYRLFLCWFFSCIALGLMVRCDAVNRFNIFYYLNVLLSTIGVYYVSKILRKSIKETLFLYVTVITIIIQFIPFSFSYFFNTTATKSADFFPNMTNAISYASEINPDYYYIENVQFPNADNDSDISIGQILTMYVQEMDMPYYTGKTDFFMDKSIPYKERYTFISGDNFSVDKNKDIVYVVTSSAADKFDKSFKRKDFGSFCVFSLKH